MSRFLSLRHYQKLWNRSQVHESIQKHRFFGTIDSKSTSGDTPKTKTTVSKNQNKNLNDFDPIWENPIPHDIYSNEELNAIQKTHKEPSKISDRLAYYAVQSVRKGFDIASGYRGPGGSMTKSDWLNRCLFLETVAGVPGMVAGMIRHLRSLRTMKRDHGWIHTLLGEAENERMHLLIFMNMKNPGIMFRLLVLGAQGVFFNLFFLTYMISPRTCHSFVGYLEEEAVKTYTGFLQDIDNGHLSPWENEIAPLIARKYYHLPEDAKLRDLILNIRADEANHRDVNHQFAELDYHKDVNPLVYQQKKTNINKAVKY